jgi:hypothetical protein
MPLPKFDNLNDVTAKFVGTICYYKDEPVYVKTAFHDDDDAKAFRLSVAALNQPSEIVDLHDPQFRYRDYNIGYANHAGIATWWYRRPAKQYQQGLKAEQLRFFNGDWGVNPKAGFQFNKSYVSMLRNDYTSFEEAKKQVRDGKAHTAAWHRDFALGYQAEDKTYPLYYRANGIGIVGGKTPVVLVPQAEYLKETLYEALG